MIQNLSGLDDGCPHDVNEPRQSMHAVRLQDVLPTLWKLNRRDDGAGVPSGCAEVPAWSMLHHSSREPVAAISLARLSQALLTHHWVCLSGWYNWGFCSILSHCNFSRFECCAGRCQDREADRLWPRQGDAEALQQEPGNKEAVHWGSRNVLTAGMMWGLGDGASVSGTLSVPGGLVSTSTRHSNSLT